MIALAILVILAIVFGIGAVIKGIFWLGLIAIVLLAGGAFFGWQVIKGPQKD